MNEQHNSSAVITHYRDLQNELVHKANYGTAEDKEYCIGQYASLGIYSYALKLAIENNSDSTTINALRARMDASYRPISMLSDITNNIIPVVTEHTNCDLVKCDSLEVVFPHYDESSGETGYFIHFLPYIETLKQKNPNLRVKINTGRRLEELFSIYFPYIENGTHVNKINYIELIKYVESLGGASVLRNTIRSIADRIVYNKTARTMGINWYANDINNRDRSIPLGVLINTIGNNDKNLNIKSLQYNNITSDIETFNNYSKNKITSVFSNDIHTSIVDILRAVAQCSCFVGIQSEAAVMAYSLCGIPTIVTSNSPHFYWYFLEDRNPYLNIARMRFAGDYDGITKKINRLI